MSSHLFSGLDDAQLERVRRHSHVADLLEGESLFYQGDEASSIFLVLSGRIKLSLMSPEGKEKVIDLVEAGSTFAEALMFLDEPHYPVTATALKSGRVIVISSREFKSMLHESIDSCFLLLGRMSARIRSLIQEIDALSLETGTVRTVNYLLSHAPEEGDCYDLDIAKSVIASRLSVMTAATMAACPRGSWISWPRRLS